MAPGVPVEESEMSKAGGSYISASNQRIPNVGQLAVEVVTNEGRHGKAIYQIGEVHRPLTFVTQTCDKHKIVVF